MWKKKFKKKYITNRIVNIGSSNGLYDKGSSYLSYAYEVTD